MCEGQKHRGLVLLSLDGGGIRGLSELLILQNIMERIQFQENLEETPLPCDYFDLIGGTSTGGIIALMLGRLRMSVTKAIEYYGILAETVFSDITPLGEDGKFKASKLEEVIKTVVKEQTGEADERMMDMQPHGQRCKTFVCTMAALDMSAGTPRLFRTYQSPENQSFNCTIWEAARATSAAPTFFDRIVIGGKGSSEPYVDGGMGRNNPIAQVLEEAELLFPDRHVACIVSIGTGHAQTIRIPKPGLFQRIIPSDVIQALRGIATDCERSAQEIVRRFEDTPNVYFRLNVEQGLQDVGLAQWERLDEVTAHTEQYIRMSQTVQKLRDMVVAICGRENAVATRYINGMVRLSARKLPSLKRCPPPTTIFTGRSDILDQMSEYFSKDLGRQRVFVLHGLGGSGKSQIAFKFVEICQAGVVPSRFSDVFFVDSSTAETTDAELKNIALAKGIGESTQDTLDWLTTQHEEWLLLLNNADDTRLNLRKYFPPCSHGNILITSRNRDILLHASGPRSSCQVSGMKPDDARCLLLEVAGLREEYTEETEALAITIVKELGQLALAVVQAGAYISSSECGLRRYLDMYRERRDGLLEVYRADVQKIDDYEWTVYTTWRLSYDRLSKHAIALLELCAFLHHDGISEAIFQKAAAKFYVPPSPSSDNDCNMSDDDCDMSDDDCDMSDDDCDMSDDDCEPDSLKKLKDALGLFRTSEASFDGQKFLDIIREIRSYSLIDFVGVNQTYSIHPLVHAWIRTMVSDHRSTRTLVQSILAMSVNWEFSSEDYAFRRTLLSHIDVALECGIMPEPKIAESFRLVYDEGGQWKKAEKLIVHINESNVGLLGSEHTYTLVSMEKLATIYRNQGRWGEAEALQVQVMDVNMRQLGPEHPRTLTSISNLALTYTDQGRWKEAEELQVQVQDANMRLLGPEHPQTLTSISNLALTYTDQVQWKEAEELQVQVKDANMRLLGLEHPDTLMSMANLAATYRHQGRWREAEKIQIQVKDACVRLLGLENPHTLMSIGDLALTYADQGRWREAEELQVQVKDASVRLLGLEHPDTLMSMGDLAATYRHQGRWREAEKIQVQVKDVCVRLLGLEHPHTLTSMGNLALTYAYQGRWKEAEELQVQVNDMRKWRLGPEHPDTLKTMGHLAFTYSNGGRWKEAEELHVLVKAAYTRLFGPEHPETLKSVEKLASTYLKQGRWQEVEELRVYVNDKRVVGSPQNVILAGETPLAMYKSSVLGLNLLYNEYSVSYERQA